MERHVFKFGKNSIALIIPKKWADANVIMPSSTIFIEEGEAGKLTISAHAGRRTEAEIDARPDTNPMFLSRWVGMHYMNGASKLRIYSANGITQKQAESVSAKINEECPGFQITSQSSNDIVIEDFTDIKEVDIEKVILRIRALISQEFMELQQGNAKTVPEIEKLVNRFYILGARYLSMTEGRSLLLHFSILNLMEDISDKLKEVSSKPLHGSGSVMKDLAEIFSLCHKAEDGDMPTIEKVLNMREGMLKKLPHSKLAGETAALLTAVAYDISGIAEVGFLKEEK